MSERETRRSLELEVMEFGHDVIVTERKGTGTGREPA